MSEEEFEREVSPRRQWKSTDMTRFENMRKGFEKHLDRFSRQSPSVQLQSLVNPSSGPSYQMSGQNRPPSNSGTNEGILSHHREDKAPSEVLSGSVDGSRRVRKSVRFQVYNAKNMVSLKQMRDNMAEKLTSLQERTSLSCERTNSRKSSIEAQPREVGFNAATNAVAKNFQLYNKAKKTPRYIAPPMIIQSDDGESADPGQSAHKQSSQEGNTPLQRSGSQVSLTQSSLSKLPIAAPLSSSSLAKLKDINKGVPSTQHRFTPALDLARIVPMDTEMATTYRDEPSVNWEAADQGVTSSNTKQNSLQSRQNLLSNQNAKSQEKSLQRLQETTLSNNSLRKSKESRSKKSPRALTDRIKSLDLLSGRPQPVREHDDEQIMSDTSKKRRESECRVATERFMDLCWNLKIVYQSRLKVDAFDTIKQSMADIIKKELTADNLRARHLAKKSLRLLKQRVADRRHKQMQVERADKHRKIKELAIKQKVYRGTRAVVDMESRWIKQVQYEFSVDLRERVVQAWKTYIKYKHVVRLRRQNRYQLLMEALLKRVINTRQKFDEMTLFHQARQKWSVLRRMQNYSAHQIKKKLDREKAAAHQLKVMNKKGFSAMKINYSVRKEIKSDKLLWRAKMAKEEFFSVGVQLQSHLSSQQKQDKSWPKFQKKPVDVQKKDVIEIRLLD